MVINAAFNGLGKPMPAVAVSTIRMFLVMVPASWIGGQLFGLGGIYCGLALANIIAAILAFKWFSSSILSKTVEQSAT
jgi:Na+-driven multidrug efflux pump